MKYVNVFVKEFYDYNKKDFWLIVAGNITGSLLLTLFKPHALVYLGIIIATLWYTFSYVRQATIMPSTSSDFDKYSWKYLQSLPLNKKDILLALCICNIISTFPGLVWFLSYLPELNLIFEFTTTEITSFSLKVFLLYFPVMFVISDFTMSAVIGFPRTQYSKVDRKIRFLEGMKSIFIVATVLLYIVIAGLMLKEYGINVFDMMAVTFDYSVDVLKSWWIIPLALIFAASSYYSTLKYWQDEKRGYYKQTWNSKRDISIMGACFFLIALPISQIDINTSDIYKGSPLLKAIGSGNQKQISKLLDSSDWDKPNKYGITPIVASAFKGNYQTYMALKKKGANLNVKIISDIHRPDDHFNILFAAVLGKDLEIIKDIIDSGISVDSQTSVKGFSPLLSASKRCNSSVVDVLLQKKANINAVNEDGESALHLAVKNKCFGTMALLLDAGIDPLLKDNQQKVANDYALNLSRPDAIYYLEKKTRSPASK